MKPDTSKAIELRQLHHAAKPLLLANAWDAGSARLIEAAGAAAIATTSAGLAWSRGYPDGDAVPPRVLAAAVADIARVLTVPLTVDAEGGYSSDPAAVAENVAAIVGAGGVGINIEDGGGTVDLLCAKITAAKAAAAKIGVELFVNARTDVYLRGLAPPERAVAETVERARRYREAGADGIFVPAVIDAATIRTLAESVGLPLNVMVRPGLPPVAELARLGVRRVSAGSAISQAAYGITRRATAQFFGDGLYDAMFETSASYADLNALFAPARR